MVQLAHFAEDLLTHLTGMKQLLDLDQLFLPRGPPSTSPTPGPDVCV